MHGLNRQEFEDLIIDLYYNQNKTFREVQKIVRKSPRDIKLILDKANPTSSKSTTVSSESSQAIECLKKEVLQSKLLLH
jgi:transposase